MSNPKLRWCQKKLRFPEAPGSVLFVISGYGKGVTQTRSNQPTVEAKQRTAISNLLWQKGVLQAGRILT